MLCPVGRLSPEASRIYRHENAVAHRAACPIFQDSDMNTHSSATRPVAVVTGALAGIGRATAFAFGAEGFRVVISGRQDPAGQSLLADLRRLGVEAEFVRADVRFEDQVANLIDSTVARFGRIDAAVNNAGIDGKFGPISDLGVRP
jgi:NAD(P)-dependent dehydrogenase (short-subunit alcohol dehydrogenase family)